MKTIESFILSKLLTNTESNWQHLTIETNRRDVTQNPNQGLRGSWKNVLITAELNLICRARCSASSRSNEFQTFPLCEIKPKKLWKLERPLVPWRMLFDIHNIRPSLPAPDKFYVLSTAVYLSMLGGIKT